MAKKAKRWSEFSFNKDTNNLLFFFYPYGYTGQVGLFATITKLVG